MYTTKSVDITNTQKATELDGLPEKVMDGLHRLMTLTPAVTVCQKG